MKNSFSIEHTYNVNVQINTLHVTNIQITIEIITIKFAMNIK